MEFPKHIALIDLETTGKDRGDHRVIQVGVVGLNKNILTETKSFSSLVSISENEWNERDPEAMAVNGITWEQLEKAPPIQQVLSEMLSQFPANEYMHGIWGGIFDQEFLKLEFQKAGIPYPYSGHNINIYSLACAIMAAEGYDFDSTKLNGFKLQDAADYFKVNSTVKHDALDDCRIEAAVLRKIMKKLSPSKA